MRSLLLKPTNALRGRKNHEMTQFDNDKAMMELCEQLMTLAEDKAKAKLRASLYEAWNDHGRPLVESLPEATAAAAPVEPVKRPRTLCKGHHRIIAELKRDYTTTPMLRGLLGYSQHTLMTYMNDIRRHGYQIETKRSGRREYRKFYRLAS